jgi:hypothetical protein
MYDLEITAIMVCIDSKALSSLAILKTLKVLSILKVLKAERLTPSPPLRTYSITISKIESITTPPSK